MTINRVILIGNLTRDPEMKYTPAGKAVATMGIAVQRFTRTEQGDYEVDFFNLVAWEKRAEYASSYLRKGNRIAIEGRLQTRSWVDQATSQKRTAYEIVVENIQSLSSRAENEGGVSEPPAGDYGASAPRGNDYGAPAPRPAAPAARTSAPPSRPAQPAPIDDDMDESDPFADE
jgi:single-strand DNA-binding protein